jgi:hypothetical protein
MQLISEEVKELLSLIKMPARNLEDGHTPRVPSRMRYN